MNTASNSSIHDLASLLYIFPLLFSPFFPPPFSAFFPSLSPLSLPPFLSKPKSLLKAGICELCGNKTDDIRMHHVRALKNLTGKTEAERLMLHMRRKSLALCPYCYQSTLALEP